MADSHPTLSTLLDNIAGQYCIADRCSHYNDIYCNLLKRVYEKLKALTHKAESLKVFKTK